MAHACPECRTENADGATFCCVCGVPLAPLSTELPESDSPQALSCEDCGHRNPAGSAYCERCGYGLVALLSLGAVPAVDAATAPATATAPETQAPPDEGTPTLVPPLPAAWRSAAAPDEDTFDPLSAPTLVMSHTAPSPLPPLETSATVRRGPRPLRWVAAGMGLLAVFALLAWLAGPSAPPAETVAVPLPAAAPASVAAPSATPSTASAPGPVMAAPPVPASAPQLAAVPVPASAPASAPPARKHLPEPVARKRAQEAPAMRAEPPPAPPASAPVALVSPPAPPPERAKTVAELCAASNLLTRGFCEQRECRRGELAADPACVKLREAEQRRLFQQ